MTGAHENAHRAMQSTQLTASASQGLPWRVLGRSGLRSPVVGLGCWAIGGPAHNLGLPMGWSTAPTDVDAVHALETGYAGGVRLFDTADVYGHGRSERLLGCLIAQVTRDEVVLVSKVGYDAGNAAHGFDPAHMRARLERSLEKLRTDYLDLYFLHHSQFGPDDQWLPGAIETMRAFREEGLIRAIGMRGPHRFALDRLATRPARGESGRGDKVARFRHLFAQVQPDVLAVRDNLLTPTSRSEGIFAFADTHDVGVLINKPLAQGLLTGAHTPEQPPRFAAGDHRLRKRWFTPAGLHHLHEGLQQVREVLGLHNRNDWEVRLELVQLAVWSCLQRSERAVALVGFTSARQVRDNLSAITAGPPSPEVLRQARAIMSDVQARLDADGEVFLDEPTPQGPEARA
jgi:methylglyoxal reductase